jgi:hypothetical protein
MSEFNKSKQVTKLSDAFELTEEGKVVIKDPELYEAIRQAAGSGGKEEGFDPEGVKISVGVEIT